MIKIHILVLKKNSGQQSSQGKRNSAFKGRKEFETGEYNNI